jgi:hypothetical protein
MLLPNNGTVSSSKRTHHLNVRYFFFTDRIASNEVNIQYCPTAEKPLQGSIFKKFRDFIMSVDPISASILDPRSVLEQGGTSSDGTADQGIGTGIDIGTTNTGTDTSTTETKTNGWTTIVRWNQKAN